MIIDSFLFFNELEMLEFRLKLLYDHVDKFIIVESHLTHSGKGKPLNFFEHRNEFAWARDKIIYHPMNPDIEGLDLDYKPQGYEPDAPQWKIENQQRSSIINACKDFPDDTILMVSDCDEIPSREVVEFRKANALNHPMSCQQQVSVFTLGTICPIDWRGTTIATLGYARENGTQYMRDMRNRFSVMEKAGWHLTYFGGAAKVKYKIESFAHQEENRPEFLGMDNIRNTIASGGDLYGGDSPRRKASRADYPDYFLGQAPKEWWL